MRFQGLKQSPAWEEECVENQAEKPDEAQLEPTPKLIPNAADLPEGWNPAHQHKGHQGKFLSCCMQCLPWQTYLNLNL